MWASDLIDQILPEFFSSGGMEYIKIFLPDLSSGTKKSGVPDNAGRPGTSERVGPVVCSGLVISTENCKYLNDGKTRATRKREMGILEMNYALRSLFLGRRFW